MTGLVGWMDRRLYPGFERNWDDRLFRERILAHLNPASIVLDLGAGAGIVEAMDFRDRAARICGVDLDPRVVDNPFLDEGKQADAATIPYDEETFDLVFADNVMEHLATPETVFAEIHRVLRPGGILLFKTPNRNHYMPMIARLTPFRFHQFVNRLRGRDEKDTFPTVYRVNSRARVRTLASRTGFAVQRLELIEGRPEYLRMTALSYALGVVYERIVNATSALDRFRILLIAELRKA